MGAFIKNKDKINGKTYMLLYSIKQRETIAEKRLNCRERLKEDKNY